jgi:hypothetical protein
MFYKVIWCLVSFYKDVISSDEPSNSLTRFILSYVIDINILTGWELIFVILLLVVCFDTTLMNKI